jgi:DNA-directed RNA polymerase alpha subunit
MKETNMAIGKQAAEAIFNAVKNKHPVSNLEQLGIGQRMINLLHDNKIYDMEDLMLRKREQLMSMSNFGERQMHKLFSALANYHLVEED